MKAFLKYSSAISLASCLLIVTFVTIGSILAAPIQEVNASSVTGTPVVVSMLTGNAITQTRTGGVQNTRNYGLGDCYIYTSFDVTAGTEQTATFYFRHSGVAGQWVDYGSVNVVTSTETFTQINPLYGAYTQVYATVATTTYPVTYTVNCVVKNRVND